jgi:hypothetical protein
MRREKGKSKMGVTKTTNADLSVILTDINNRLQVLGSIDTRLTVIEEKVGRMDKAIFGNGKPGLIDDHRDLKNAFYIHCHDAENQERAQEIEDGKKEKWGVKKWAVVVSLVGALATNFIGLAILFIRYGTIH